MQSNFKLKDHHAIELGGHHLDLHNVFDFAGFEFDNNTKVIVLKWSRGKGEWVPENAPKELTLTIENVNYIQLLPPDTDALSSDDACLLDFTYFPSNEREQNEHLTLQSYPEEGDDMIFTFVSGRVIRVGGDKVTCNII